MIDPDATYFNEEEPISARLATALGVATRGGGVKRFVICESLAESLEIDTDSLGPMGYDALLALVPELEQALREDPTDWITDIDRAGRIARDVTDRIGFCDTLDVLSELGLATFSPRVSAGSVEEFMDIVKQRFRDDLSPRLRRMLDGWRARGVWASPGPKRLVMSTNAKPRGARPAAGT